MDHFSVLSFRLFSRISNIQNVYNFSSCLPLHITRPRPYWEDVAVTAADTDTAQRTGTVVELAAADVDTVAVLSFPNAVNLLDLVHIHTVGGQAHQADYIALHPLAGPTRFHSPQALYCYMFGRM